MAKQPRWKWVAFLVAILGACSRDHRDSGLTVEFSSTTTEAGEADGIVVLEVRLSRRTGEDVTVALTFGGDALDPADYTSSTHSITVPTGELTGELELSIVDDGLDEVDERVDVALGQPSSGTLGPNSSSTVVILDDDPTPSLGFVTTGESTDEAGAALSIEVALEAVSGRDVEIPFRVAGSATDPADFRLTAGPLRLPAGQRVATLTLTPEDDALDEDDETIVITLEPPLGALLGAATRHETVLLDDDPLPLVGFGATDFEVDEGSGSLALEVALATVSGRDVTVPFSAFGEGVEGVDFRLPAGPLVIPAGASRAELEVTILQDAEDETTEDVFLVLGPPVHALLGVDSVARIAVRDDDFTQVSSAELVEALHQISSFVTEHALETTSGGVGLQAPSALADREGGRILLASGNGEDEGLEDTDFASDGAADHTAFEMTLQVPAWAASLVLDSRFVCGELRAPGEFRQRDEAVLETQLLPGGTTEVLVLGDPAASFERIDPYRRHVLPVVADSQLRVRFVVRDAGDGAIDSALWLSSVYFSRLLEPDPPPEEEEDYGDEIIDDVVYEDTIHLGTGCFFLEQPLLARAAPRLPFELRVRYHSTDATSGPMGPGWTHSYNWFVQELPLSGAVRVKKGDGSAAHFVRDGSDYVPRRPSQRADLQRTPTGGWLFTARDCKTYEFDPDGKLIRIRPSEGDEEVVLEPGPLGATRLVDTLGGVVTFSYSGDRLVEVELEGRGERASFAYDERGRLVHIASPGTLLDFTYDDRDRVETVRNYLGVPFLQNVFQGERIAGQFFEQDESIALEFVGGSTTVRDRGGHERVHEFSADRRPTSRTDAGGVRRTTTFTTEGDLVGRTGPSGTSRTERNAAGKPVLHENAAGEIVELEYDLRCRIVLHRDAAGFETLFEWDPDTDRLLSKTDPRGGTVRSTWNDDLVESLTDRRGNTTFFTYTPEGFLESLRAPLGGTTSYRYDDLGRVEEQTDPAGLTTVFSYDGGSDRVRTLESFSVGDDLHENPLFASENVYDADGRLVMERNLLVDALPGTRYEYVAGLVSRVVDATGRANRYEYSSGLLSKEFLEGGTLETEYLYDESNRLVTVRDVGVGDGRLLAVAAATYDDSGNKKTQRDPNGNTYSFGHDALGRLTSVEDPLGGTARDEYDPRGLNRLRTNARGQTIRSGYDANGKLAELAFDGRTITHVRDAGDNPLETTDSALGTIERVYDELGRMVARTDPFGRSLRYEYDAVGNLLALTYPNGDEVRYRYDDLSRLTRVSDWNGRVLAEYEYDASGDLVVARMLDGSTQEYTYDLAHRLTKLVDRDRDGAVLHSVEYTLDALGRRSTAAVELPLATTFCASVLELEYGPDNRLARYGDFTGFEYDADGNMIRGTLDGASTSTFRYDALNRLVAADGDAYVYDADGSRVEATLAGRTVQYVQDPSGELSRLLEEHVDGELATRHVYGLGLLASIEADGGLRVYHFDPRGSTVALTDEGGRVTDRFAYDPFGRLVARQGSTRTPFAYNGRDGVLDDGNGLYWMRARHYSPALMRFLQRDLVTNGSLDRTQSLNRYAFVEGDPVNMVDPNGQFGFAGALVGALVNATVTVTVHLVTGGSFDDIPWDEVARDAAEGFISGFFGGAGFVGGFVGGAFGELASNAFSNALDGKPLLEGGLQKALVGGITGSAFGKLAQKVPVESIKPSQVKSLTKSRSFQRALRKVSEKAAKGGSYTKGSVRSITAEFDLVRSRLAQGILTDLQADVLGSLTDALIDKRHELLGLLPREDDFIQDDDDQDEDCFCEPAEARYSGGSR